MARTLLAIAAFSVPCSAFVPHGSLRSQPSAPPASDVLQQPAVASPPEAANSAYAATAAASLAAAALALGAAQRRRQSAPRPGLTQCHVAGITFPITEKFDPMELGNTDAKMERYTNVEIKHGRVAMIACLGYAIPEFFKFPGCEKFENGLAAFSTMPVEGWFQLFAFIGAHDALIKPREGGMGAYDLGLGTELLEGVSAEEVERRQTAERNNGRLAMIGIMGLMVQDGLFGKTPIALLKSDGWWGPSVDWFIKDIPICQIGTSWCALKPRPRGPGLTAMRFFPSLDGPSATTSVVATGRHTMDPDILLGDKPYRKSPSLPFMDFPEELDGWVGGEKGFDPLSITDFTPMYTCREAELKHGRICMLATLGWIATDLGARFPGEMFQNVSTVGAHDKMVELGMMQPFLATVGVAEVYGGWLWKNGAAGEINRDAGDFFLGKKFLPQDEEKANEMRLKELENGRLAMLAFSGICTQAVITGKTWPFA